jgi:hypothetical protein
MYVKSLEQEEIKERDGDCRTKMDAEEAKVKEAKPSNRRINGQVTADGCAWMGRSRKPLPL